MTESEFLSRWYLGVAIATVIIIIVALLVILIIVTARRILANATRALTAANEIVTKTMPIWELDRTNAVASELLEGAHAIDTHATQIADALEAPVVSR